MVKLCAFLRRYFAIFASVLACVHTAGVCAAEFGDTVSNTATITYTLGPSTLNLSTAPADFIIEPPRTPSTIEFLRYAPSAPDAKFVTVNGSDYATGFDSGGAPNFAASGAAIAISGAALDFSSPVSVTPAENFFAGELIFVRVIDHGYNGDATIVETLLARIVGAGGDNVTLRLYESGPNTGVFLAYIRSTRDATPPNDNILSIASQSVLTATYIDAFDSSDISTDTAGVDPFGRVFDSTTGDLIDDAEVTIVDAASGQPALVMGVDGVSEYPATLMTGQVVVDASGRQYDLSAGEFLFPIMFPGEYRLIVRPPESFAAPSLADASSFTALRNAPFTIMGASYLQNFTVDGSGDVMFDVPLDPSSNLVVTKSSTSTTASIGDFVRYVIEVENRGDATVTARVIDQPERGLKLQSGSVRLDGARLDDPQAFGAGARLEFEAVIVEPGATVKLAYVMEVAAGVATGPVQNRAFVAGGDGAAISNVASAEVYVRDDFLRNSLTVVGRVIVDECTEDRAPDAPIVGLEGVRLYMETGAYTTSDKDGLFHFENVDPKTHVVQLDTASLPAGYEPVTCKNNTRFAGSAISQFVDAQGGALWRADFYVRKTVDAFETDAAASDSQESSENDALAHSAFDKAWLNRQTSEPGWVYPDPDKTPSARAVSIGVKHAANERVELFLNGAAVPATNFAGRDVGLARTVAITRWRGVDLVDGENRFEAVIRNANGAEVERLRRTITFVSEIVRANIIREQSRLVADGVSPAVIAVRLTDGAGRAVHPGRLARVVIDPPYRFNGLTGLEEFAPLSAPLAASNNVAVGADGIARVELEPTLETGKVRLVVELSDGSYRELFAQLTPAMRDWIIVGLAEGSGAIARTTSNTAADARDVLRDGRVAVFAKGSIGDAWLVTAAIDTDKSRGGEDDELFDQVAPDERYSIFGDRSNQQFEAQSRYPVYVRAENGAFRAVFGDFDTGLNETSLGKYSRRLSGSQVSYEGDRLRFTGFAADTNQRFLRQEIAADGTSGPFTLDGAPMVRNSETLIVEARNRLRPDEVLDQTPLQRYIDYDIDFRTGELVLRLPVPAANSTESFNVIVAEFETSMPVERNIVTGGRGALRLAGGNIEIGATIVHEDGLENDPNGSTSLAAVDLRADISDTTRVELEYGGSRRRAAAGNDESDAVKAEIIHNSARVKARAFFDRIAAGFGLGQQSSASAGVQRTGGEAKVLIGESHNPTTGEKRQRFVEASVTEEKNLSTGARRDIEEAGIRQESNGFSGLLAVRRVAERTADNVRRNVLLLRSEASQHFDSIGLTLRAKRETPISGENASILYPTRTRFGFDQRITERLTLNVDHEIQKSDAHSTANTIVGVTAQPWRGGRLTLSADRITQDTGQRLGATFGVDQQFQIDDNWSASAGVSRRQQLGANGSVTRTVDDITPDLPISPLEDNEDFTSLFAGVGYRDDVTQASARFEARKGDLSDRYTLIFSGAREVSETLSFAGAARLQKELSVDSADRQMIDARLAAAWRPRGDGIIILDRFDVKQVDAGEDLQSWKAINNLVLNVEPIDRWQISLQHGFKYAELATIDETYSGITQLIGVETRYDISRNVDIGFRGSALYSHNAQTIEYAYGPSIGVNPIDNVWFSFGWNFAGFRDNDFLGAEFSQKGPFLQLRIKLDQNSAKALLNGIADTN